MEKEKKRLKTNEANENPEEIATEDMDFETIVFNKILCPELMASIFNFLTKKQRMACKLVCKYWFSVLMTDNYFKEDRHIFLDNCTLTIDQPPLALFIKAPYNYSMLTIGENVFIPNDNTSEYWDHFGDEICCLDISQRKFFSSSKYIELLTSMKHLKKLKIHNERPIHIGFFQRALEDFYDKKSYLNIEELIIECVDCNPMKEEYFEVLDLFINIAPKLRKIYVERIKNILIPLLQDFKYKHKNISISFCFADNKILDFESLPKDLDGITIQELDFTDVSGKLSTAEQLVEKYSSIKSVKLKCESWPSDEIKKKLTKLIYSTWQTDDHNELLKCSNLIDLTISQVRDCFNQHQPFHHVGVRKLSLGTWFNIECDCIKMLLESFPNLSELELSAFRSNEDLISVLTTLKKQDILKILKLNFLRLNDNCDIKKILKMLPTSFTLSIADLKLTLRAIKEDEIDALTKTFPAVTRLTICADRYEPSAELCLCKISSNLTNLEHLRLERPNIDETYSINMENIQTTLIECGQKLKTVDLLFIKAREDATKALFEKMPNLHSLSQKFLITSRINNGRVQTKKRTKSSEDLNSLAARTRQTVWQPSEFGRRHRPPPRYLRNRFF